MRFALFTHSLVSCWNHGNAHFLRGVLLELLARGHTVRVFEPRGGWSRRNLVEQRGEGAVAEFHRAFPQLDSCEYDLDDFDAARALDGVDLALVHEWSEPALVGRLGEVRRGRPGLRLLFHDTHHRAVTRPEELAGYDLSNYDGVLAFGEAIRRRYLERSWAQRAWTWHEAADIRTFRPVEGAELAGELVWIGNWGDGERTAELHEFVLGPVAELRLAATFHGARYPEEAQAALREAGVHYPGWLPNHEVPRVFARHLVTIHVPRRPYVEALPGIPTIRPFEALACGIPLVCAPWRDVEGLFRPGEDYLVARNGKEMAQHLNAVLHDGDLRAALVRSGLARIRERHTCGHRVDELLAIAAELGLDAAHSASGVLGEQSP